MSPKINGQLRSTLLVRTLDLLRNRPRSVSLSSISQGTGLPREWLISILRRPHSSPSVDRIQQLYEYLGGNKLEVH
jgi:hypothetical protein